MQILTSGSAPEEPPPANKIANKIGTKIVANKIGTKTHFSASHDQSVDLATWAYSHLATSGYSGVEADGRCILQFSPVHHTPYCLPLALFTHSHSLPGP